MRVSTVTGSVHPNELGRVLVHEHLRVAFPGAELEAGYIFDRAGFVERAVDLIHRLKAQGIGTIVDASPIELGRDPELMREVAEKGEINVICATGFYTEKVGLPGYWRIRSAEDIAALYINEIENGCLETGIRPGVIKCATSRQAPSDLERKVLRAVCIAHKATGLPIMTHTEDDLGAPEQQEIFAEEGVALDRCLIGHCSNSAEPAYHRQVCENGSFIGFDRIGMAFRHPDTVHADNIARLMKDGFVRQIMMSQDRFVEFAGKPFRPMPQADWDELSRMDHLVDGFLPLLKQRGVTDAQLDIMLIDNPRRFLTGAGILETQENNTEETTK
ncbi:hypothetical protein GLS40_10235 [Pseudooceanicola sp. 216_PA32_1]|uniref:Phosphotriesterase-related protein n=1 Tax=Pseudooceanicola pacificus TaxID=2676438 RepID=A0A844W6M8_9RHOB|nr:hypothetical protein [Pseudooceanicola pacificus]MWB78404.1 hypothetical protein [Pseudooceanicola pacificus]